MSFLEEVSIMHWVIHRDPSSFSMCKQEQRIEALSWKCPCTRSTNPPPNYFMVNYFFGRKPRNNPPKPHCLQWWYVQPNMTMVASCCDKQTTAPSQSALRRTPLWIHLLKLLPTTSQGLVQMSGISALTFSTGLHSFSWGRIFFYLALITLLFSVSHSLWDSDEQWWQWHYAVYSNLAILSS